MTPVSLKPAATQSRVKHSTTEPLHSDFNSDFFDREKVVVVFFLKNW